MVAKPTYIDVDGAPFKIGDRVRVTRGTDETFNSRYRSRVGVVEYLEYQCGCGQSYPRDPLIGVKFTSNGIEEFWAEELTHHPAQAHRRVRL